MPIRLYLALPPEGPSSLAEDVAIRVGGVTLHGLWLTAKPQLGVPSLAVTLAMPDAWLAWHRFTSGITREDGWCFRASELWGVAVAVDPEPGGVPCDIGGASFAAASRETSMIDASIHPRA